MPFEKDYDLLHQLEIERIVLTTDDIEELYALQIFLGNVIDRSHKQLALRNEDDRGRINTRGKLSWAENIQDVCKKRQQSLQEDTNAFNKRFRILSKKILPEEKYNEIARSAER